MTILINQSIDRQCETMTPKTTHPPAGADSLVVILGAETLGFVINPVLSGAVVITIIALIFNNLDKKRKYPTYWR